MRFLKGWEKYRWRLLAIFLYRLTNLYNQVLYALRRKKVSWFCRARIGKRTLINEGCTFSVGSLMDIGSGVTIGRNSTFVILEVNGKEEKTMIIGDNTWISENFLMLSMNGVIIGDNVLIGESVSVRDSTHNYKDIALPIRQQGDIIGSIRIEDDVWIGRGCLVQGQPEGITIGKGAILAANSVASRSIPPFEVWGGVPARFIKKREIS